MVDLNVFVPDTDILSEPVNENFSLIKGAIDDIEQNIIDIEGNISDIEQNVSDIEPRNKRISEYSSDISYSIDDVIKKIGTTELYKSITNNNTGNPLTDIVNWVLLCDLSKLNIQEIPDGFILPSGIIVQYGRVDSGATGSYNLVFPNEFPTECNIVLVSSAPNINGYIYVDMIGVRSWTSTGALIYSSTNEDTAGAVDFTYIAIGK